MGKCTKCGANAGTGFSVCERCARTPNPTPNRQTWKRTAFGGYFCPSCNVSLNNFLNATNCPNCNIPLDGSHSRHSHHRQQEERASEDSSENNTPTVTFECLTCSTQIRLRLQATNATHRCPACNAQYKSLRSNSSVPVFLVVPQGAENRGRRAAGSRRPSPQVLNALAVLDLEETATFDDVRRSYRDLVKSYHPDMVAHLGPDLRTLAEQKTKEINLAYQVLESHLAGS